MAFNNVVVNQKKSSSGRQLAGFDFYSGLIVYGTAPVVSGKWNTFVGNSPNPDIKAEQFFSLEDAENAGILPFTENTAPTSTYLITTKGNTGDTIEFKCTIPKQNGTSEVVSLGKYTGVSADSIAVQGAAIAAAINAGTSIHGFSATFTTATLTITAPKSVGISLNSGTPYSVVVSATFTGTWTQNVIAGTKSQYAAWHYHISEYFRKFPKGNLWVGVASFSSFNELVTLSEASKGKIRHFGVYDIDETRGSAANITGTITLLDVACKKIQSKAPASVAYSPNIKSVSNLATYTDQNLNTANKVQAVISQDGLAKGGLLFVQLGQTIGNIGIKVATSALKRPSASDAQPNEDFNNSDGSENDTMAFGNGQLSTSVPMSLQEQLDTFRFTFFRQFETVTGTYWTDNKTCISNASQYAFTNDNHVSDKVQRICQETLTPQLNAELIFNKDNTLQDYTIAFFQNITDDAIRAQMITGFGSLPLISDVVVSIDPTQPVKKTNNLTIDVTIYENGIARKITVNLGLAV